MTKFWRILVQIIPIVLMIALIPLVKNDYWLLSAYVVVIIIALSIKYEKRDWIFLTFGFFGMIIPEYIFTSTKVEIFNRNSLFGLMPIWLPFLWGYAFLVMKRVVAILEPTTKVILQTEKDDYFSEQEKKKQENLEKMREYIKGKTKITNNDIKKLLGVSDATVIRYLNELEKEGLIEQMGETGQSVYYKVK